VFNAATCFELFNRSSSGYTHFVHKKCVWPDDDLLRRLKHLATLNNILSWVDCYYIIIRHEEAQNLTRYTSTKRPHHVTSAVSETSDQGRPNFLVPCPSYWHAGTKAPHATLYNSATTTSLCVWKQIKLTATSHNCSVNVTKNGHGKRTKHKNHWHGNNKTGKTVSRIPSHIPKLWIWTQKKDHTDNLLPKKKTII